jgi:hypothetical protein
MTHAADMLAIKGDWKGGERVVEGRGERRPDTYVFYDLGQSSKKTIPATSWIPYTVD